MAKPVKHGAHVEGQTNLPDGTDLMVNLSRASVGGGEHVTVTGGKFATDVFPKGGAAIPPGDYVVEVASALGSFQPASVKAQLGTDYEALTGPMVVKDEVGRTIEYKQTIRLDGSSSATADRAARKAAYGDHVKFSDRTCRSNPDTLERLTGERLSEAQREKAVRECRHRMTASRRELEAEKIVEP